MGNRFALSITILIVLVQSCSKPITFPEATFSYKTIQADLSYNQHLNLDINGDSITDYIFTSEQIMVDNKPSLLLMVNPDDRGGSRMILRSEPNPNLNGLWANPFAHGDKISANPPTGNDWNSPDQMGLLISSSENGTEKNYSGFWVGQQNGYLAVRFKIAGENHYGWIRLSHTAGQDQLFIHDYAYNNIPEQPIMAGQQ